MSLFTNIISAGSSAVLTVTIIHPIDVVKTRLQVSNNHSKINYKSLGIKGSVQTIYKNEGIEAFWKGIKAAWLRESTYTSLRIGLYEPIKQLIGVTNNSGFGEKFIAGSLAGAIGSIFGNPFDVIKTRLMATEVKKINFTNIFKNIYNTEGFKGFYKGLNANILRACVLNGTKMACYDQIKEYIVSKGFDSKSILTQFIAAFGSGFFMAITVTPFDMIRTQLMNNSNNFTKTNKIGFIECVRKIINNQGLLGLYSGFIPIWLRFAPTTCLQLIIFEQIKPIFEFNKKNIF